ncbi:MAG TPA: hypothetical protein VGM77_13855 [Gemmatimonadales bacterium]|jgi:hypothetical protein
MGQQPVPTVGDTITVVHRVAVPQGAVVEVRALTDTSIATLVGQPVMTREADSVSITYTLAVWAPGEGTLVLPGPVVVDMRGTVDTLADARMPITVASLLPTGKPAATIAPKTAVLWLPHLDRSMLPFATLVPLALLVVGLVQWGWRRRGAPFVQTISPVVAMPLTEARVAAWLAAGESRLLLDHLEAQVRGRPEFDDWRGRAELLRFAAVPDAAVEALVHEGLAMVRAREPAS